MYERRSRPKRRNSGGFSLLEILVAVTILSVGILGVLAGFSVSTRAAARAYRNDQAAVIAQGKLDEVLVLPASELEPASGESGQFHWALEFEAKPLGLVRATVVVGWLEQGRPETYRLSQLFLPQE